MYPVSLIQPRHASRRAALGRAIQSIIRDALQAASADPVMRGNERRSYPVATPCAPERCERLTTPPPLAIVRWSRRGGFPLNLTAVGMAISEHGLRVAQMAGWSLVTAMVVVALITGMANALYGA